jgi:hypothetical protein
MMRIDSKTRLRMQEELEARRAREAARCSGKTGVPGMVPLIASRYGGGATDQRLCHQPSRLGDIGGRLWLAPVRYLGDLRLFLPTSIDTIPDRLAFKGRAEVPLMTTSIGGCP